MSTSPARPTVPEGTDPVVALRTLQEQLAQARYSPLGKGDYPAESRTRDESARDAERTAGMNLLPVVNAVEELVAELRRQVAEADPFTLAGEPGWYGSRWVCPVDGCTWDHREPSAVSSVDVAAAERVRAAMREHLASHAWFKHLDALTRLVLDWPAHCSDWIGGTDPENPDMCPEYASPGSDRCALHDPNAPVAVSLPGGGWTWMQRAALVHGGSPDANPQPTSLEEALELIPSPMRGDLVSTGVTTYVYDGRKWMRTAGVFGRTSSAAAGPAFPGRVLYPDDVHQDLVDSMARREQAELGGVRVARGPLVFRGSPEAEALRQAAWSVSEDGNRWVIGDDPSPAVVRRLVDAGMIDSRGHLTPTGVERMNTLHAGVLELPSTVSQETADRIAATLAGYGMPEVARAPFRVGDLVRWNAEAHPWFEGRIVGETAPEERFAGNEKWNLEVTHPGSMYADKPEQLGRVVHVTEERLTLVARAL
jgi:hypothetical protein